MNRPPALNAFLSAGTAAQDLGSVEVPLLVRILRPATLALWLVVFAAQIQAIVSGAPVNWMLLMLTTATFVGVYLQFWWEESERGRHFHRSFNRLRGRIYEDDATGLPNSRHFIFELRRQMMRSLRNGRGFALVIAEVQNVDTEGGRGAELAKTIGRGIQQGLGAGDFLARLQGCTYAAIVLDEGHTSASEKAEILPLVVAGRIPLELSEKLRPVVTVTGYQGEAEVQDLLRRAQQDFVAARNGSRAAGAVPRAPRNVAIA